MAELKADVLDWVQAWSASAPPCTCSSGDGT